MKKIVSIILLVLICLSCTNQETSSIDPTKLVLVRFYPDSAYERNWIFNENGLLKDIKKQDGTVLEHFTYDANGNLLSNSIYSDGAATITHTFTYDNNGHVTSANGIPVSYDPAENAYIKNIVSGSENYTYTYSLNAERLLIRQGYYGVNQDGTEQGEWYVGNFTNGNLTGYYDGGAGDGDYQYDTKINPFKTALLPIVRTIFITKNYVGPANWSIGEYSSNNNVLLNGYDSEGPEDTVYEYEYNTNNLPVKCISNNYYMGNLEGSGTHSLYYYQGDIIP
ncbi:hypothetical protein [Flavobacterium sp. GT3R68]|uniref:hypothetical protein n=1 Tax=Flavobacterium sp. GT3R68 TaxID=2594437 RepID=UPI000F87F145|nr:hypothetical protein [Flavobacterium sp. GT3R68]RTY90939.1 hypothetical protein EKL32_19970 [Flavobacterium sp. GSN2]TRW90502.1 hypothetical protein FNW07_10750 [Flavobacterium sp. GT3R68]